MSAHGMTRDQVEEFRDALAPNKKEFGVKSCEPLPNPDPDLRHEWGLRIVYEYDDAGNRVESSIDVFEDYVLASIMHALHERASTPYSRTVEDVVEEWRREQLGR